MHGSRKTLANSGRGRSGRSLVLQKKALKTSFRWLGTLAGLLVGCSDAASPPTTVSVGVPLIGGQPDTATRGVVGMVVSEASGCTGSLIAPNLVLTARHCVASINS